MRIAPLAIGSAALLAAAFGLDVVGSSERAASTPDAGVTTPPLATAPADAGAPADASDDAPVDAAVPGTITLRMSPSDVPPSSADLTDEGTLDWAHWGDPGGQVIRKASGGNLIGDYALGGTGVETHDLTFLGFPLAPTK